MSVSSHSSSNVSASSLLGLVVVGQALFTSAASQYVAVLTTNMDLTGEQFFWYRYRIVVVCSVTGAEVRSVASMSTANVHCFLQLIGHD